MQKITYLALTSSVSMTAATLYTLPSANANTHSTVIYNTKCTQRTPSLIALVMLLRAFVLKLTASRTALVK